MIVVKRNIGNNIDQIKKIVNETSVRYDNFTHFIIGKRVNSKGNYWIALYFYEDQDYIIKDNKYICVEHLCDVANCCVESIGKYAALYYDGFMGMNILENKDNEYTKDVILTYKVSNFNGELNLVSMKYMSGGGSYKLGYSNYTNYRIYKFDGEEFREEKFVDWQLAVHYGENNILIIKDYGYKNEELLFRLNIAENNNEYKINISRFVNKKERNYSLEKYEIKHMEIKVDNMIIFVRDLIKYIEGESNIKVSKLSYKGLENNFIKHFKYYVDEKSKINL